MKKASPAKPSDHSNLSTISKIKEDPEKHAKYLLMLSSAEHKYGKGAVMLAGASTSLVVECISTGHPAIDKATGRGVPRGRVIEVFGPESAGKTTLALTILAAVQVAGGRGSIIDVEHALDPDYARKLGVDVDSLLISQPDNGEQALDIVEMQVKSEAVDIIIVDSVAALVTQAELDGEMGDQQVGTQARLMSKAMRKLTASVKKANAIVLFINQIREKVGMVGFGGSNETSPGGRALKFYASMRFDVRKIEQIKRNAGSDSIIAGHKVKIKIVKNKVFPPFKTCVVDLLYPVEIGGVLQDAGFDKFGSAFDLGIESGEIVKKGNTYSLVFGDKIGVGREAARQFIKDNPELYNRLIAGA